MHAPRPPENQNMKPHLTSACSRAYSKLESYDKYALEGFEYHFPMAFSDMGKRIRAARRAHGLTQQQLADACGVSLSAVSQWETGSTGNLKLKPLLKLMETLHIRDLTYLVHGDEDQEPPSARSGEQNVRLRSR